MFARQYSVTGVRPVIFGRLQVLCRSRPSNFMLVSVIVRFFIPGIVGKEQWPNSGKLCSLQFLYLIDKVLECRVMFCSYIAIFRYTTKIERPSSKFKVHSNSSVSMSDVSSVPAVLVSNQSNSSTIHINSSSAFEAIIQTTQTN